MNYIEPSSRVVQHKTRKDEKKKQKGLSNSIFILEKHF